jgi:hypothetical protein
MIQVFSNSLAKATKEIGFGVHIWYRVLHTSVNVEGFKIILGVIQSQERVGPNK